MISFIKGSVYTKTSDTIIVENNGIGYEILVNQTDRYDVGSDIMIHTYQHVREDEISLFGFFETYERDLFLLLITVKGIGPKTANNILSKASADEISQAIYNSDVNYLKKLPGIGPKSAQQIILDLQNKLANDDSHVKTPQNEALNDAMLALKQLGFSSQELTYASKQLKTKVMTTDEYLKAGLQLINKRKGV